MKKILKFMSRIAVREPENPETHAIFELERRDMDCNPIPIPQVEAFVSICFVAMSNASNPNKIRLQDKFSAPIADLKSVCSFGIVMQPLRKGKWVSRLRVMIEFLENACAHFARKALEILLSLIRIAQPHEAHLMPYLAIRSSDEINLPALKSRSASRASFLSAARYAGLNVSMSSTVSSSSCLRELEMRQSENSAAAMMFSSLTRSH